MRQCSGPEWAQRWPELFVGLTTSQSRILNYVIADNVLEGWQPTQADIEDLIGFVRGDIAIDDYIARVRADLAIQ
jgi:hypothetical protein